MAYRSSKLTQQNNLNMNKIEEKVRKARFEKKIFIILGRNYETIRQSLFERGWLEKILENQIPYVPPGSERLIIANLLKYTASNFIWQPRNRPIRLDENRRAFVNSIYRKRQFDFTTKDGLKNCADSLPWNYVEGIVDLDFIPKTHVIVDKIVKDEFFEDYKKTAFTSFINFLNSQENFEQLFSIAGTISTYCIEFTIAKIEFLLKVEEHEDIDMSNIIFACFKCPKHQNIVLYHIQQILKGSKKFRHADSSVIENWKNRVKDCADKINERWPNLKYDGFYNIWIFKPIGLSSGNGIILENDDGKIREILSNATRTFVAQKYIERPLLIHNRKFDIRIYILTTILDKTVNVWLYKDCYIKFATKAFDLKDFHRSIHVTNYAVQKHFMNIEEVVPFAKENMWSLNQLIDYFRLIGKPRLWEANIYPAIKKTLLAVMIPSFEYTEIEHKSFELNGADIMITFDYKTALLEINSVPALFFSKPVKALITNKLLEDVIKVVVDHSKDPNSWTGEFELIYTQEIPHSNNVSHISIVGTKIERVVKRKSVRKTETIKDIDANNILLDAYRGSSNISRYVYLREKKLNENRT